MAHEVFHLAEEAGIPEAVRRVMELTGAGQSMAQAYVEALLKAR